MRVNNSSLAAFALAGLVTAQTSTDCNPLEKTCPADTGLSASTFDSNFLQGKSSFTSWSAADGTSLNWGSKGAEFTITKEGQAPTVQTDFYIFFGTVEVKMQAATGTGIVSSIVLESDDLDEIDWEFLGGDTTQAETNYFGKGNTTTYNRAIYYPVSTPQTTMHTYTVDWSPSSLVFSIDGTAVRTLNYADADGGANYPQTPMRLKLGNWAGGASTEPAGTVQWAGGATDFSQAPFTMYVESVSITNANPASSYVYGDKTGSWESIKVVNGSSSSSASSAGSNSGSASSSKAAKDAATSSHSVAPVAQTAAAVSVTRSGSASTAAISAVTTAANTNNTAKASTLHTATASSASLPTSGAYSGKKNSTSSSNATSSSNSSSPAQQFTSGGSVNTAAMALFSVIGLAMGFWML